MRRIAALLNSTTGGRQWLAACLAGLVFRGADNCRLESVILEEDIDENEVRVLLVRLHSLIQSRLATLADARVGANIVWWRALQPTREAEEYAP